MSDARTISFATVLGVVVVTVAIVCALGKLAPVAFQRGTADLRAERGWSSIPTTTRETRASQASRLANYAWIDKPKGVVAVPIERAMELTVADHVRATEGGR